MATASSDLGSSIVCSNGRRGAGQGAQGSDQNEDAARDESGVGPTSQGRRRRRIPPGSLARSAESLLNGCAQVPGTARFRGCRAASGDAHDHLDPLVHTRPTGAILPDAVRGIKPPEWRPTQVGTTRAASFHPVSTSVSKAEPYGFVSGAAHRSPEPGPWSTWPGSSPVGSPATPLPHRQPRRLVTPGVFTW